MAQHRVRAAVPTYLIFLVLAAAVLYPLVWMVMSSLKSQADIFQDPMGLPQSPSLDNYARALGEGNFKLNLINSLIVTVPSVFLLVLISSLAAFAFARLRFPGRTALFYLLLIGVMVPPQSVVIPVFQVIFRLGLLNTFTGLILVYLSWSPVAILILTTFFRGIPQEIFEAAQIDGAGLLRSLFRIALPLAGPAIATVSIFYFVWIYNDLLYPLVLLQDPSKGTIPIGLMQFQGQYRSDWATQNAALTLAMALPVLIYMFFQDKFVRGLTAGALK